MARLEVCRKPILTLLLLIGLVVGTSLVGRIWRLETLKAIRGGAELVMPVQILAHVRRPRHIDFLHSFRWAIASLLYQIIVLASVYDPQFLFKLLYVFLFLQRI